MTNEMTPICPECQKNDKVFKVSQIYKESVTIFNKKENHPALTGMFINKGENAALPNPYRTDFTRLFAPPTGRGEIIRAIHPDLIAGVLSIAGLYLLYSAYTQQPSALLPSGIVLALVYIVYFIFRKNVIQKYNLSQAESKEEVVSVEQAIFVWMKLYYCARDGLVIEPESGKQMPLDEMKKYLLRGK